MKITALLENTATRPEMKTEHGLSLFIETEKHRILFDMGQTSLFAENAQALGVDLSSVDIAVLSHGHYDHGGGLSTFLQINDRAPVYMSPYAFLPHYNGVRKYIGLDTSLQDHSRIVFTKDETRLDEGLTLFSCNQNTKAHNLGSFGLTEKTENGFVPDDFRHEIYLLIEENGKRILISGCSHKGILDIAEWFAPDVLIGGFHFSKLPLDDTLTAYAKHLDRFETDFYTCHCTGTEQYAFMKQSMNRLHYLSTGQSIHI